MAEEVVGVDDKAFRTRLPVPKWCQEIRPLISVFSTQKFCHFALKIIYKWPKVNMWGNNYENKG